MNDKRFEIAPPGRDGRRCVAEWLEITREGERHVLEYFREYPPAPEYVSVGDGIKSVGEPTPEAAALRTFAGALRQEASRIAIEKYGEYGDRQMNVLLERAISNLLPEVPRG